MASTLGTRIYTWLCGEEVGRDAAGNRYYREKGAEKRTGSIRKERRWVVYEGDPEASRVPPEWHLWLHHTTDEIPAEERIRHYEWEKEHKPNMTGTPLAYRPPGHTLEGAQRAPTGGDYEAWTPDRS